MKSLQGYEEYAFSGDRGIPMPMTGSATNLGRIGFSGENIVELRVTGAGMVYSADDPQNLPAVIYIHGTTNYDGLQRIYYVRAGRYVQVFAPYVAESFSGAYMRVGFKSPFPYEFGGFSVHLPAVSGVSSNLEIINYSAKGSAFDNKFYSQDMKGIQDINYMFNEPKLLAPNDRLDLTWADSNREKWGTILFLRDMS